MARLDVMLTERWMERWKKGVLVISCTRAYGRTRTYSKGPDISRGSRLEDPYPKRTKSQRVKGTLWGKRIFDVVYRHGDVDSIFLGEVWYA